MSRHITCGQHISGTSQSHIKKPDIFAVVHVVETCGNKPNNLGSNTCDPGAGGCFFRMFL